MSKRILIIGAGFAGMWSALGAARLVEESGQNSETVEIVLVAPSAELHIRPRFYEVPDKAMKAPLTAVFDAAGVKFIKGTVDKIRTDEMTVDVIDEAGQRTTMSYDRLVLASGSRVRQPAIPGLQAHAQSVDQFDEIVALDDHLKGLADQADTPARNTAIVIGGGFTGIEIAAELPARLRAILGAQTDVNVVLIEQATDIGPELGSGPRPVIQTALKDLGVVCRLGTTVAAIDAGGVETSTGERIEANTVIWTAGLRASALTEQIPGTRDAQGRLHVDRDLRVLGVDNVFATGDVAYAATDDEGHHAMMSCQHAMGLGRSAGHNVAADLLGLPAIAYSQPKYVTCLALGPWGAVYTEGWEREVKLQGAAAKALKHQINTQWIYPPPATRAGVLAAADPLRVTVA